MDSKTHDQVITLSIVIPCYNEEGTLKQCVERVLAIQDETLRLELIIVDDCSKDNSIRIARELAEEHSEIQILSHDVNQGKGAALRTGFQHARGDFVGIQDADLEYDPVELKQLLGPLVQGDADVVYGSRYLRPESRRVLYFWHSLMNRTLTFISNMFTDLDLTDMETGYKLFRRDVIQNIQIEEDRFGFEPEITAKVAQQGHDVYEMAISYTGRTYTEGKKIDWRDGVRALYCILHYAAPSTILPLQILLYLFVGGIAALVDIFFFVLIYGATESIAASTFSAFFIAAGVNYYLCIKLLFRHAVRWKPTVELAYYALLVCAVALVDYAFTAIFSSVGVDTVISKILAAAFCFLLNFFGRRFIIFPQQVGKQWKR